MRGMKIETNKSLRPFNTFGVDASAKYFVEIRSAEEFRELLRDQRFRNEKKLILGGGSNLLLTKDFNGLVVKNALLGVHGVSETVTEVILRAGGGEPWEAFVRECVARNYAGLENLSLIPGSVGAAPVQNIGAYGVELRDAFEELEAIDLRSGETVRFSRDDCEFGYRDSVFKKKHREHFFITAVSFRLTKLCAAGSTYRFKTDYGELRTALKGVNATELTLEAVHEAVCKIRRSKLPDPKELGNAGSFFKNPSVPREQFEGLLEHHAEMPHFPQDDGTVKVPAGWLIEQCGWKGKMQGRAGVHQAQALVLVNRGDATGQEILELALAIQENVLKTFGVKLSPEVCIL